MTIVCPGCGKHYRLEAASLGSGRRLRCTSCRNVFTASPDGPAIEPPADGSSDTSATAPLALIGDEPREFRDLVRRTLERLGCRVEVSDDGEAAFRFAVARRPDLMILNVYLRRLLGVAVCEGVKGSPDLRRTKVALVGSVFKSNRFVRSPGNLYGADDYFEDVIPEGELLERLRRLLGPAARSPAAPPAQGAPARRPAREAPAQPGFSHQPLDPAVEIRRLARIMLSDLKIYHPEGYVRAIQERRFFETFRDELTKGKDLIMHRFPDLPGRLEILVAALREGLLEERAAHTAPAGESPA
ncbi:MAG TPA: zinc-ribbon domain-containing protein [Candidatus Polarisedimenticolia bacterium]|nr:zinc-ribbon domain-containing protein [Candidatus Polarisedimenticolia bacterium]